MNPNSTIRPWILACGRQFGIRSAHDYVWPDPETRPKEMYCTYRIMSVVPAQSGAHNLNSATNYTVHRSGSQEHKVTVQIDLYNSQDGMYELAAFCVGAKTVPAIRSIFHNHGCAFVECVNVTNASTFDNDIINYHHVLTCTFYENVEISIDDANGLVKEIELTLSTDDDYQTRHIFIDGIEPTAGDTVSTGTVTLTEL